MRSNMARRALLWGLVLTGFAGLLMLCGEVAPGEPVSVLAFVGTKLAGVVIILLCVFAGKFLNRRGLLPDSDDSADDAGWED